MIYAKTEVGGTVEFLASKDYQAIPFKAAVGASAETTVIKAGTPLGASGEAATITTGQSGAADTINAVGILLYDVDTAKNPNCAIVVQGIVDLAKIKKASGLSGLTAATLQAALPGIVARSNIGVNS